MFRFTLICVGLLSATLAPVALSQMGPSSIYKNDRTTRTAANAEQTAWTAHLTPLRCTGSLLNEKYLLTANHCNPKSGDLYTSGACLELGCREDLEAVDIAETDIDLDYTIVEIKWKRSDSRSKQRYAAKVLTDPAQLILGKDGQATQLFTVGFPQDKPDAMNTKHPVAYHAVGSAKVLTAKRLRYNIGTINGNSGGAVWTVAENRLVSMTNAGPKNFLEQGWKDNDPEDSKAWNSGARMDEIYKLSAVLPKIFPSGQNPDVNSDGYLLSP
jgi:hypothetical protein